MTKYGIIHLQNHFQIKQFGSFAPKHKKFSFSASFGVDYLPEEESESYKIYEKYLKELKAISVREEAGKKLVEKVTNRKDVQVIIDPTMMLTKEEWEPLAKKPENLKTDKFIVKSFLGNISDSIQNELQRIASQSRLSNYRYF